MFKSYKELRVWQQGIEIVEMIYQTSESFPKQEIFGITSQLRRAAVSIPLNIAEGWARKSSASFTQFLRIALASLAELETIIIITNRLKYISSEESIKITNELQQLAKMINALISKININKPN